MRVGSPLSVNVQTWDVSRVFLATLQLAADRNIDIVSGAPEGAIANNFDIQVHTYSL